MELYGQVVETIGQLDKMITEFEVVEEAAGQAREAVVGAGD